MGSPSDDGKTVPVRDPVETNSLSVISDEDVIPKGALDPVYEAKAKVLNHAVSHIFIHCFHLLACDHRDNPATNMQL
jgi:hypothetical protein